MRNLILTAIVLLTAITTYAQEGVKFGVQGGIPFGDFNNRVSVVLGANVGYAYALGETIDLGLSIGYIHGLEETFQENLAAGASDVQFLPLAGSFRIWPSNSFSFGGEVGQAIGINDGNDGGLYYRPQLGYMMGPRTEVNLSYTGIELDESSWATVTFGIRYTLPVFKEGF
ncbi:hypothetical protein [Poritiphilus flavus]|uniref:Outer membrane protein beta-barrel domain-containing protein n=1 Tax=Poritiphilus flavus TaxID=2697053 RepID=A0A6L9EBA6_9FLAO|nr:hypothetical protein [Poritiphilus flavus]NAS12055.1 hypothetical protein [Poritiphilus flavus]